MPIERQQTVLILGATGMLGSAVFRYFSLQRRHAVFGSVRSPAAASQLPADLQGRIVSGVDAEDPASIERVFADVRPTVVINCVGLIKQLAAANDPLLTIPINSLLPHRLSRLCAAAQATLIHVSTDCVFSGQRGMYREEDVADATDLYGRSKHLGEVVAPHAVTLRTSIIGPELQSAHGLVGWFLSQSGSVRGYTKAIFSGLPTVELARVMHDFVLPNPALRGLYHVSAEPIDKCTLLREVARVYGKQIEIVPDDRVVIDRSLDSSRFRAASGYAPPSWPELIGRMRQFG
jgi:dTDP-4-dehydrorhamnose reductase